MIVDTSALMAVLLYEPEVVVFSQLMMEAPQVSISAGNYVELVIVASKRRDPMSLASADRLLETFGIEIEPVTVEQARLAREAHLTFGRGRHPAALNYGDCFAYALARATGRPLLYKGSDFSQTDIVAAKPRN